MQNFTQMTQELEALVVDPRQLLVGSEAHTLVISMRDELQLHADVLPEELVIQLDSDFSRYLRQFQEQDQLLVIQTAFRQSDAFASLSLKKKILYLLQTGFKMKEIARALGWNKSGVYRYSSSI
jgi:DNA-binding NarL/FixJ family response regulator